MIGREIKVGVGKIYDHEIMAHRSTGCHPTASTQSGVRCLTRAPHRRSAVVGLIEVEELEDTRQWANSGETLEVRCTAQYAIGEVSGIERPVQIESPRR